ncbi:flavin-containing monooxygenase [Cryptosporangium aurantiacum]|uniref:Predicted flavoprotein CzcO associated with the cation diffusion facilitator CzcD n=1 Tax=Cryptosporangium aurantiacum TaxID=134849 RepID=A0A1M7RI86_9ACTN|nr:NAD(P)/FAD-dependent oxidoreductase [Cryptosporangium aurantiacum]SHN45967.1 Predicted flavoprotein CzcO associated with the cation diffusion facilitator CzcD [Cryptosporangium aurantiacum]
MEHVDVLIVGAGLSGIGAACHLKALTPGKTVTILEARDAIGGTWDLFRYPGVRSDSDMFTLGYSFRPWPEDKGIARGELIRDYIVSTARTFGVDRSIRFRHRVLAAAWSSETARWTVTVESPAGTTELSCSFLYFCAGYYRYDEGYTPAFPGIESFAGRVVHPQSWPDDLEYDGKRVVVIGSGATAVTLVPALAETAAHVAMLQRSPTYVATLPTVDPVAAALRDRISPRRSASVVRWKNVLLQQLSYQLCRRRPELMKKVFRAGVLRQLPPGFDVDTHFAPRYDPWDQRLCISPDGDLFAALSEGTASIVTGEIETFTPDGVRLTSGEHLPADLVVTATGLNLLFLGGATITVDGREMVPAETLAYKGMMLAGVPNLALAVGYTNASWTLKADLVARYVTRLLRHMDAHGYAVCVPEAPPVPPDADPLIDLKSGYVLRDADAMPRQGPAAPWRLYQNYPRDVLLLKHGRVDDGAMRFSRAPAARTQTAGVSTERVS